MVVTGVGVLLLVAVMCVIALVLLMMRIGLVRFLGYPNAMDIGCTCLFLIMFSGSFAGMVVAGFASLLMSVVLYILRATIGAEKAVFTFVKGKPPVVTWVKVAPRDCSPKWLVDLLDMFHIGG